VNRKFDIIMPTVCQPSMTAAINSVIAQTHKRWELWVISNGVHYNSQRAELPFDERIHYLYLPEWMDDNFATAKNIAVEFGKARYIAYLSSDHTWATNHLSSISKLLADNSVVANSARRVRRNGELAEKSSEIMLSGLSHTREIFQLTNGWKDCENSEKILWEDMVKIAQRGLYSTQSTVRYT